MLPSEGLDFGIDFGCLLKSPLLSCHRSLSSIARKMLTTGPHNLRSFLAANSIQNYFLIARILSFWWHSRQKCRIWYFATKCYNFWYMKWKKREELKRKWVNVESEFVSSTALAQKMLIQNISSIMSNLPRTQRWKCVIWKTTLRQSMFHLLWH